MSELVEVALFSDDVEGLKHFYGRLVGGSPEDDWAGGATYSAGPVKLLVHRRADASADGPANDDHFALAVSDLDGTCEDLRERGVTFVAEPRDYPWGRSAYVRDPDGRIVELIQG
jgi:predicted enzyme related to lactoylglutathione lyase